jgi:hypothetical protein
MPAPRPDPGAAAADASPAPGRLQVAGTGVALFLFIPLVLWLYVGHPEPVAVSAAAGVALMLGHRLLARPYMQRVREAKCLWCNRVPPRGGAGGAGAERLALETAGGRVDARCCAGHAAPAARFFAFVHAWRWVLRAGIFVPLLLLLAALAATAVGVEVPLAAATDVFRLAVGVTVNLAAWGYLAAAPARPARVPFPVHNFFLLGLRPLLWIFRLVGLWWIWKGAAGLLAL